MHRGGWRGGHISTGNPVADELLRRARRIPRALASFRPQRLLIDWTLQPKAWRHQWIDEACGIADTEWLRCAARLSPASRGRCYSLWMLVITTRYLRHPDLAHPENPDWTAILEQAGGVFGRGPGEVQRDVREVIRLRQETAVLSRQHYRAEDDRVRREAKRTALQLVAVFADDEALDDE